MPHGPGKPREARNTQGGHLPGLVGSVGGVYQGVHTDGNMHKRPCHGASVEPGAW